MSDASCYNALNLYVKICDVLFEINKTSILPTPGKGRMDMGAEREGARFSLELELTTEQLEDYLEQLARKGRAAGTLETYRRNVYALYRDLPADKRLRPGTLEAWRKALLERGYSPRTVNVRLAAANGLLAFLGRRDLQLVGALEADGGSPELTRAEYLRLLSAARLLGRERAYLMTKLFGSTGLSVQELPKITVEFLQGEPVLVRSGGMLQPLRLPEFLRRELLSFARREGISSGPLFRTRSSAPMGRTAVADHIKRLCRAAQVDESKANPRCLRRLWQATQESIRAQVDALVEQACDQLFETEQLAIGWNAGKEVRNM